MDRLSFWKKPSKLTGDQKPEDEKNNIEKTVENIKQPQIAEIKNLENNSEILIKFCEYLESVVLEGENMLNKAYEDQKEENLQKRLKKNVNELICLQREMKSIVDNIQALKVQLSAVKNNSKYHKSKLKSFRNEENKARLSLISESNLPSKSLIRFANDTMPKSRFPLAILPAPTNSTDTKSTSILHNSRSNNSTLNNSSRAQSRKGVAKKTPTDKFNFIGPIDRTKSIRKRKIERKPGVTLFLHPINESDVVVENDNESMVVNQSHPVTPNTSIVSLTLIQSSSHSETNTVDDSFRSDSN